RQLHVPGTDGCGMLAWALDEAGASAEADDLAHACLAAGEEISQVSYLLGLMTSRGGNYAAAWAHFERALDTASPDHRAWLERDEALLYVREQVLPEEASGDGTR